HVLDPVARRVHLEPVARVRGHERSPAAVLLDAQVPPCGPPEDGLELLVLERDPQVVDARDLPVAGLHDDVDGAALELRQPELEPFAVEPLPRRTGLRGNVVLADPAVAGDEAKAEPADVPRLDVAQ